MSGIKSLAKDTVIYGISSIVGRFLNWMLVPLYTQMFLPDEYGVVTYIYSVVALALVVLTYGMETGFFRFANDSEHYPDPMKVYSTALISLGASSTLFLLAVICFISPLSSMLHCPDNPSFVWLMGATVAIDAFSAIPFSLLRFRHRPLRFATLRCIGIAINIGLNLFFILLCPWLMNHMPATVAWFYNPIYGIGYIFLANFISSVVTLLLMLPELKGFAPVFDRNLWVRMLRYSFPLLILGVAGIMNQTVDKLLLPDLVADKATAMTQLGIYGGCYKIAIIMVMFIQAFRFAYEPFIFSQNRQRGNDRLQGYRDAMKWYVIFGMFIFMGVMFYIDILKYFISPRYFSGLAVVPVIMLGEFFFGVFFNLSLWYKLTDRTHWGMWFSLFGLAVTIALNYLLVPYIGYMGCAWAAFACYGAMMLLSYFVGRVKHPIGYNVPRLALYFFSAMALYGVALLFATGIHLLDWFVRAILLAAYLIMVCRVEHMKLSSVIPLKQLLKPHA